LLDILFEVNNYAVQYDGNKSVIRSHEVKIKVCGNFCAFLQPHIRTWLMEAK